VDYGKDSISKTYLESTFEVFIKTAKGVLNVSKDLQPIPGAYIKVFSRSKAG